MGYDTSHHPVDVSLITERLVPYLLGRGDIDDLVERQVRIARVRARANAWGLGAYRHLRDQQVPFESDLYVWGRPFFITLDGTAEIADAIDRYLEADPEDVDLLAAEMLDYLDPNLVGVVQPSDEPELPDDEMLARQELQNVHLLRDAISKLDRGDPVNLGDGETADPAELLRRETVWVLVNFAAQLRPGWMDRGQVWPSTWFAEAGVALEEDMFESPAPLLGELQTLDVEFFAPTGIVENYMVGAMVRPERLSALVEDLTAHSADLLAAWGDEEGFMQPSLQKLLEAARDAEHRGLAFCEATEIYSGFSGILN